MQTSLHYAEPQGRKAHAVGLKRKTDDAEREQRANLFVLCRAARKKSLRSGINEKLLTVPSAEFFCGGFVLPTTIKVVKGD